MTKKAALDVHLKDLKLQITEIKKQLETKSMTNIQEIELTKQLRILENDLRKQENDLFFDMAQVDVDTENEIKELTAKTRFKASPSNYFTLYFEKM